MRKGGRTVVQRPCGRQPDRRLGAIRGVFLSALAVVGFLAVTQDLCDSAVPTEIVPTYIMLRASLNARHSRSGVTGMSRSSMPRGRSASDIAFRVAPSAPEVPDSPTPFAPSALAFVGTGCSSQTMARIQSARGIG